ncbi:MAG: hypothetical protein R3C10_11255 [Pirellulales bacterium]
MHLEKATTGDHEAKLAGWISSNDATLFVLILFVIVALVAHARWMRGQSQNEQLQTTNVSLNHELTQATEQTSSLSSELQHRDDELTRAQHELARVEDVRQQTQHDLLAALERIAQLDQTIASLSKAKSSLETEKTQLMTRTSDLEQVNTALSDNVAVLRSEKQDLAAEKSSLDDRLDDLATRLEGRVVALAALEEEKSRLHEQVSKLDAIVATLETQLAESGTQLQTQAQRSESDAEQSRLRIAKLQDAANQQTSRADEYLAKLQAASQLVDQVQAINVALEEKLDDSQRQHQLRLARQQLVSRELVGIKGDLRRVAVLFDASASMKNKDGGEAGDRWQDARTIASTWLSHLQVDECVLIVFSSDVRTFPEDGSMSTIQGPDGDANRHRLLQQLETIEPAGWTNTLAAFQKAYEYDEIDTILLFSDGARPRPDSGQFDAQVAERIYRLCAQHPDVPVNTIGLGNYFDQNLSTFLRTVARVSGGTFRGR